MNILAIDTSNQVLGVAILKNNEIIGEIVIESDKNHSVRLMPTIVSLMKQVNMEPSELDQIIVAKGPGSYTGIRIGVTTAKSLAWALDIPVKGVSSLEVLAYEERFFNGYICPFFDARRETVFTSLYEWQGSALINVEKEQNMLMFDWLSILAEKKQRVLFLSPHITQYKHTIEEVLGDLAVIPEDPYHISRASKLILVSNEEKPNNIHELAPNYIRLAEAEVNWLKRQKEVDQLG